MKLLYIASQRDGRSLIATGVAPVATINSILQNPLLHCDAVGTPVTRQFADRNKYFHILRTADKKTMIFVTDSRISNDERDQFFTAITAASQASHLETIMRNPNNPGEDKKKEEKENKRSNDPKIALIQNELQAAQDIMIKNIDKVLERGEKIETLMDKSDDLAQDAMKFHKAARQLNKGKAYVSAESACCCPSYEEVSCFGLFRRGKCHCCGYVACCCSSDSAQDNHDRRNGPQFQKMDR